MRIRKLYHAKGGGGREGGRGRVGGLPHEEERSGILEEEKDSRKQQNEGGREGEKERLGRMCLYMCVYVWFYLFML
jgi:hypothetical protein